MKRHLSLINIFFFCFFSTNLIGSNQDEWNIYFENDTVKIEYTYQLCDFSSTADQEVVIFKFTNLTNKNISVKYKANIWHNDICINCDQNEEGFYTIQIASNEVVLFDCHDKWNDEVIFSGFVSIKEKTNYKSLTKFELNKITIVYE